MLFKKKNDGDLSKNIKIVLTVIFTVIYFLVLTLIIVLNTIKNDFSGVWIQVIGLTVAVMLPLIGMNLDNTKHSSDK